MAASTNWSQIAGDISPATEKTLPGVAEKLNHFLSMRTFFDGYQPTAADTDVYKALKTNAYWEEFVTSRGKRVPHLLRWFTYVETLPAFQELARTLPKPKKEQTQTKRLNTGAQGSFDIDLPGAEFGRVITRFPPEPSGYLHIGHAKAALLNNYFARSYGGTLIMRFDDTNPAKEKQEYVDGILEDLSSLNIHPDKLTYTSDHFEKILELAEKMLTEGKAYVDKTPAAQMREEKGKMIESKYRTNTVEENLRLWGEMKKASPEGQLCVMRAKIDMHSKNGALRDPSLFRVNLTSHWRTGTKYKVYPLYDFACPIVDSIEGVTHALRSSEYHDRDVQYYWLIDALGIRKPFIWDFSRLNFKYTLMSKRKLQWFVDRGIVPGWDSPSFPTIRGLFRRGLTVEALTEFVMSMGASKNLSNMEMEKLWVLNKKFLDPIVPRYTAIARDSAVLLELVGGEGLPPAGVVESRSAPRHKQNPALGNKVVSYGRRIFIEGEDAAAIREGEEVTLMNWGNAIVKVVERDAAGKVTRLAADLHLAGSVKSTEKKLTWLADLSTGTDGGALLPVVLEEYSTLITKEKLEEEDKLENFVNPRIKAVTEALGDPGLRLMAKGEKVQLERRGYFAVEQPHLLGKPLVLVRIPEGKILPPADVMVPVSAASASAAKK